MSALDIVGAVLLAALILGLAIDIYQLGKRHGYTDGQVDAALDFHRGYRDAISDVIVEAERQGEG